MNQREDILGQPSPGVQDGMPAPQNGAGATLYPSQGGNGGDPAQTAPAPAHSPTAGVRIDSFWADDPTAPKVKWNTQPLRKIERAEEYPLDALPAVIRDAVQEVADYVKAPVPLVAASALSAVSTAVQARFSVQRDAALRGPASLFLLTVAESGERKSTVDRLFTAPIFEWETQQAHDAKPALLEYRVRLEEWELKGERLKADIRKGVITTMHDPQIDPLIQHELTKPTPPRVPCVMRGDDTPEALAKALSDYPVASVISAEAGVIFGAHGMNADSVTRNLAQANECWDGGRIQRSRVSSGDMTIEGMRVTMGLQVQASVLENFIQKTGSLARGIGYFARFLFSQPESTQGTRYYSDPPADMPARRAFHERVRHLLNLPAQFDEYDRLQTHYIQLDRQAHACWVRFHDEVEEFMGGEEQYAGIRDVASKAAENAARLACCMHVFSDSPDSSISVTTMASACVLMRWYLSEAVRFGRTTDVPEAIQHAEKLEEWLVREWRKRKGQSLTVNMARQSGPNALRVRTKFDAAIDLLKDHGRIRVYKEPGSKTEYILLAPAVLVEWS